MKELAAPVSRLNVCQCGLGWRDGDGAIRFYPAAPHTEVVPSSLSASVPYGGASAPTKPPNISVKPNENLRAWGKQKNIEKIGDDVGGMGEMARWDEKRSECVKNA